MVEIPAGDGGFRIVAGARRELGRPRGVRTIRVQPDNRHEEDAVWVLAPHDLAIALEVLGEVR